MSSAATSADGTYISVYAITAGRTAETTRAVVFGGHENRLTNWMTAREHAESSIPMRIFICSSFAAYAVSRLYRNPGAATRREVRNPATSRRSTIAVGLMAA